MLLLSFSALIENWKYVSIKLTNLAQPLFQGGFSTQLLHLLVLKLCKGFHSSCFRCGYVTIQSICMFCSIFFIASIIITQNLYVFTYNLSSWVPPRLHIYLVFCLFIPPLVWLFCIWKPFTPQQGSCSPVVRREVNKHRLQRNPGLVFFIIKTTWTMLGSVTAI